MLIEVDLEPNLVYALRERAMHSGLTVSEVVADECRTMLGTRTARPPLNILSEIRARVERGECDAEIAAALRYVPGRVAELRRTLGLPANRRRWA